MSKIQEVFGQYAVELSGSIAMFSTMAEAASALVAEESGEEHMRLAKGYTASAGIEGKRAKAQENVILSYLSWYDSLGMTL